MAIVFCLLELDTLNIYENKNLASLIYDQAPIRKKAGLDEEVLFYVHLNPYILTDRIISKNWPLLDYNFTHTLTRNTVCYSGWLAKF